MEKEKRDDLVHHHDASLSLLLKRRAKRIAFSVSILRLDLEVRHYSEMVRNVYIDEDLVRHYLVSLDGGVCLSPPKCTRNPVTP